MVRTAGAVRISGGKSSKKSSGAPAPSSSGGSNKSGSQASGSRLPPIPHTDVPSWQKPITKFFNTGGSKSQVKQLDPDEKTKQETVTNKIQQISREQSESAQSSSSLFIGGIETDSQGKKSQANNELMKNDRGGCSIASDASDTKVVPYEPPAPDATTKKESSDKGDESVNERSVEQVGPTEKHKDNESVSQPSVEEEGSAGKQNEVVAAVSIENIGTTDDLHHKENSCDEKNESISKQLEKYGSNEKLNKVLVDISSKNIGITGLLGETENISNKGNRSTSPVGEDYPKKITDGKENLCQKELESGDGEKGHAEENHDGEPAAKKMKT